MQALHFNGDKKDNVYCEEKRQQTEIKKHVLTVQRTETKEIKMDSGIFI